MIKPNLEIKLSFVTGLSEVVLNEISRYKDLQIIKEAGDSVYLELAADLGMITSLGSVSRAYVVAQDARYNPLYISNHKSVLGDLVGAVVGENKNKFKSFKITSAGANSPEVRSIAEYIKTTYGFVEAEEADLKIHIIKVGDVWEVGAQITPRPLSLRDYKVENMSGAMDPTIAYAMNYLCELEKANSYLNVFSGSGTLLIEAGQHYLNIKELVGFDNDKKRISLAMQNLKKAGLVKRIQLKEADIFDKPDFGKFDVITSDLPFGMVISKNEDLSALYQCFVEYCEDKLNQGGRLAVYTSEHEVLKECILKSKFKITKTLELKLPTAANFYLEPKIFVCSL